MKRLKQQLHYRLNKYLNKGQVLFMIVGLSLTLFVFLVIILGNLTTSSVQFSYVFRNFVSLRSLAISGLRYALWQINQNPGFTISSGRIRMPNGDIIYSVSNFGSFQKRIRVEAILSGSMTRKILNATATIDSSGKILDLEVSEE